MIVRLQYTRYKVWSSLADDMRGENGAVVLQLNVCFMLDNSKATVLVHANLITFIYSAISTDQV